MCMSVKNIVLTVLFFCCFSSSILAQLAVSHPFLDPNISSWHQFSVEETGVQKINSNFLKQLGIPVESINPKTLRIFGRGGQMLPLENNSNIETLHENHIWVVGEEDGSFDKDDYILFMGYANDTWSAENQSFRNSYHTTSVYYITYGSSEGKRLLIEEGSASISSSAINKGVYQSIWEEDNYNIGSLGRRWFGVRFSDKQKESFTFQTPNVATGSSIDVAARLAAAATSTTTFTLTSSSTSVSSILRPTVDTSVATEPSSRFNAISGMLSTTIESTQEVQLDLSYSSSGDFGAYGYLDFMLVQYHREFTGTDNSFMFTLSNTEPVQELVVSAAQSETTLWELKENVVHTVPQDETSFSAEVLVDVGSTFYLATNHKTPVYRRSTRKLEPSKMLQNLLSLPPTTYLLITSEEYREYAERLVAHRQENRGLEAHLVTVEEIYEAFSTGQQDVAAIRNFIRFLYLNQGKKLQYLCLFGDTSYDYQKRTRSNDLVVPTFHSLNSFSLTNSFMSDDFFAMMDTGEGLLSSTDKMDLAVGRMVFSNEKQATVAVDKVIEYESAVNKGSWNNSFTLLSDDVDQDWEYVIQEELDKVGDALLENKPFLNITKLHLDAFKQVASAGGDRYPDAQLALENRLMQGTLAVNYFGHGGEDGLSGEFIVDKNLAATLFHPGKYPLFITSTCEFTRFDNHERQTAGEILYQNPTGGAIGLISTTRQIYVTNGINYNKIISKHLFSFENSDYTSIAEALRKAKSEFTDVNQKRIIFFVGDPAITLHIPKPDIAISHVNGIEIQNATDEELQFRALDKVTLNGAIVNPDDSVVNSFNGTVVLQVFDKQVQHTTLGNDGHEKLTFTSQGKQIFQGLATVSNGVFTSTFVVPKDIDLDVGKSRLTCIAFNQDKSSLVGGFSDAFTIGGLSPDRIDDNQGPEIEIFLNDRNFVDGDKVFSSPTLIVDLADENGINTAGGIGHDITAVLDNNQISPYVLNPYYSAALDDFSKGTVAFPLHDLSTGLHSLTLKAWDTYNNPSEKTISFWVADNENIQIEKVFNSPNPVVNQTTFYVQHNRPREILDSKLHIFTIDGKRVWHESQDVFSKGYLLDSLRWDATSYNGQIVKKGTYIYTIELISSLSQTTATHSGKIIIK